MQSSKHLASAVRVRAVAGAAILAVALALPLLALAQDKSAPPAGPAAASGSASSAKPAAKGPESDLLRTGGRTGYVHRFTIVDADQNVISPKDPKAQPYSPRNTCGRCHPNAVIEHGWHFDAFTQAVAGKPPKNAPPPEPRTPAGRPGEPWIFTSAQTGTQIPLSTRGWPGTFKPSELGLTPWEMALTFGRNLPGGLNSKTVEEPSGGAKPASNPRWALSGRLDVDCLICHANNRSYSIYEWADQIKRQNFRYAPAVAAGLGTVVGNVRDLPDDFDPDKPTGDKTLPKFTYDQSKFDANDSVFFDVVRRTPAERCYACHSTHPVGSTATPAWQEDIDVHLKAGLSCADCHRHGLDHVVARGYEGEAAETKRPEVATLSCRGCHLGTDEMPGGKLAETKDGGAAVVPANLAARGGRLGAPVPLHKGLPPLHLEKLSCTACHSGAWPQSEVGRVQTSMAHNLNHGSKVRNDDTRPLIQAPVFVRFIAPWGDEKITPAKMLWPAFWGRATQDGYEPNNARITPIPIEDLGKVLEPIVGKLKEESEEGGLTTEQISKGLQALAAAGPVKATSAPAGKGSPGEASMPRYDTPVYVQAGKVYRLNGGKVVATDSSAAGPYVWPLAHDVRPAQRALGAGGRCTDCHSADSPFIFAKVEALSPSKAEMVTVKAMHDLQGLDGTYHNLFAQSFQGRPYFKVLGFLSMGIVALVVAAFGLRGITRLLTPRN